MLVVCIVLVGVALFYWKNKHKEEEEEEIPNEIRYGSGKAGGRGPLIAQQKQSWQEGNQKSHYC